jgi:dipeptidase D
MALAGEAPTWAVAAEDAALSLRFEETAVDTAMTVADTAKLLQLLSVRNGVLYKRTTPPIMPETSRNLARIRTEAGVLSVGFSSRSEKGERIAESRNELDALAEALGGSVHHHAGYPGWVSPAESALVTCWQAAYERTTGKSTVPALIHAGLECGLISAALEGLEAISVGCNIHDLHTPAETLELDSMDRIWRSVVAFLGMI